MGDYDGLKQAELQQACRDAGLPAGGTNADMIERLEQNDLEVKALLGGDDDVAPPEPPPGPPELAPVVPQGPAEFDIADPPPPPPASETAEEVAATPRIYRVAFPCPSELSTGLHEDFRRQAWHQAAAKGHNPGDPAGVRRSGWTNVGGVRHALYEVPLRR